MMDIILSALGSMFLVFCILVVAGIVAYILKLLGKLINLIFFSNKVKK